VLCLNSGIEYSTFMPCKFGGLKDKMLFERSSLLPGDTRALRSVLISGSAADTATVALAAAHCPKVVVFVIVKVLAQDSRESVAFGLGTWW